MDSWFMTFKEFGLAGLLSGAGTLLLFFVVKWTLETTKEILRQAAEERKVFNGMTSQWIQALDNHTLQAKAFHDEVKQAHEYQRQEHLKLMEMVSRCEFMKK
jgi:hypothetical protein